MEEKKWFPFPLTRIKDSLQKYFSMSWEDNYLAGMFKKIDKKWSPLARNSVSASLN